MNHKLIQAGMIVLALGIGASAGAATARYEPTAATPGRAMTVPSVAIGSLDEDQIKTVQLKLKDLGYYKVEIDGLPTAHTRAALGRYFEHQTALSHQGRVSDDALRGFGFDDGEIARLHDVDELKRNK